MKVFIREKFIQDDTKGNYERIPYIKEWVDECDGLSYAEIKKLGYEVMDDYMVEVKDLLTEISQLKAEIRNKEGSIKSLKITLGERTDERDKHSDKEYLCKSVINEIREEINYFIQNNLFVGDKELNTLLEILDKAEAGDK